MNTETAAQYPALQLLDGGVGSELKRRGVRLSGHCWSAAANLTDPTVLADIHRDYIRAGADIVTANTFATTRFVLGGAGFDSRFDEINRAALTIAREAADSASRQVCVAGSLSCLPPRFDRNAWPEPDDAYRDYVELCGCFVEFGADLIVLEMLQDTEQAALACRAAQSSQLPFWIGISAKRHVDSGRFVAFDDPKQPLDSVVETLAAFDPAGIAVMHSPPEVIAPAIEWLKTYWGGAIGAYAEVPYAEGPPANALGGVSADDYAVLAADWFARGATMIGGCCGTTPAHIAAIARTISSG